MIIEDYVDFKTAKLLKERGFDGECKKYYELGGLLTNTYYGSEYMTNGRLSKNEYLAPTHQMVLKWLRSKNIFIDIFHYNSNMAPFVWLIFAYNVNKPQPTKTYEKATENAIKYVLENWDEVNKVLAEYYKYDSILPKI